jgi:hypothetical protein
MQVLIYGIKPTLCITERVAADSLLISCYYPVDGVAASRTQEPGLIPDNSTKK